ncbi:MAG: hypothetical protein QF609_00455, partial [Gammaproteobacteria bacterium]|nr:hypothetical protein [Gammaproteobacteria bacterium]
SPWHSWVLPGCSLRCDERALTMGTYFFAVLGLVTLCVLWALFQLWINRVDPEVAGRAPRCGGCKGQCEE